MHTPCHREHAASTGKDIVLMLRMGYSTEDVVRDLEASISLVHWTQILKHKSGT